MPLRSTGNETMDFLLKVFPIKLSGMNSKHPEIIQIRGSPRVINSLNLNPINENSRRSFNPSL